MGRRSSTPPPAEPSYEELLSALWPSHYIGTRKFRLQSPSVRLHAPLFLPDLYEVGMSYLGHKILYAILNNQETSCRARVRPCRKLAGRLLHGVSLATLLKRHGHREDAHVRVRDHPELCFTNVLYMLELPELRSRRRSRGRSIPLAPHRRGRRMRHRLEPLAPFMDLMLLGEGEEMIPNCATS